MLMASKITLGPLVPEDFGPLFCWINDVAAEVDASERTVRRVLDQVKQQLQQGKNS